MCLIDKLALTWLMILVLVILGLQHPGGFNESLDNFYEGWFPLILKFVFYPWLFCRVILFLVIPRQKEQVIFIDPRSGWPWH